MYFRILYLLMHVKQHVTRLYKFIDWIFDVYRRERRCHGVSKESQYARNPCPDFSLPILSGISRPTLLLKFQKHPAILTPPKCMYLFLYYARSLFSGNVWKPDLQRQTFFPFSFIISVDFFGILCKVNRLYDGASIIYRKHFSAL